jgi:glutamine amidotransferase
MIIIVDYGLGNLGSIKNMLRKLDALVEITDDPFKIESASKLILPGVGSFDDGMKNLKEKNLIPLLNRKVLVDKTPILGICLGMQLMTSNSEEGSLEGLSWIEGSVKKFPQLAKDGKRLRIPHMGWNLVSPRNCEEERIFDSEFQELRFYFVHSYYVEIENAKEVIGVTNYGREFVSAFKKDNIVGMQFHPEKSHKFGMAIFRNFINS